MKFAASSAPSPASIARGSTSMQGMYIAETFWWDLDDRTRGFTKRVQQKLPAGVFPNMSRPATTRASGTT